MEWSSPWWPHSRWETATSEEILGAWGEALALADDGQRDAAAARLEALLSRHPDFVPAASKLAALLAEQGKTADAARWLARALAADPNYPPALNNQGNLLLEQGRIDEAHDHYQRALAVDPQYATARHNLAVALRRRGDISGFVREFKRAQRMRVNEQGAELREHRRRLRQEGRSGCLGVLLLVVVPAAVVAIARWL